MTSPAITAGMATGVVGREHELGELNAFLHGNDRGLVLTGSPGVGKTTLWQLALARAQEQGMRVLVARPAESEAQLTASSTRPSRRRSSTSRRSTT